MDSAKNSPLSAPSSSYPAQNTQPTPPPSDLPDVPIVSSIATTAVSSSPPDLPPPQTITASPPPSHRKPFPFMLVTFVLFVILAGFGASFLFFQGKIPGGPGGKKTANTPVVTPPVSPVVVSPTPTTSSNPFASPSAAILNPFASPSPTYANPFGQSQNPFSAVVTQAQTESQPYQNPFATPTP